MPTTIAKQKVIDFPSEWVEKPYGVSLLTLLARIGTIYSKDDTPIAFIENQKAEQPYQNRTDSQLLFKSDSTTLYQAENGIKKYITNGNLGDAKTYTQYKTPHEIHEKAGVVGSCYK